MLSKNEVATGGALWLMATGQAQRVQAHDSQPQHTADCCLGWQPHPVHQWVMRKEDHRPGHPPPTSPPAPQPTHLHQVRQRSVQKRAGLALWHVLCHIFQIELPQARQPRQARRQVGSTPNREVSEGGEGRQDLHALLRQAVHVQHLQRGEGGASARCTELTRQACQDTLVAAVRDVAAWQGGPALAGRCARAVATPFNILARRRRQS